MDDHLAYEVPYAVLLDLAGHIQGAWSGVVDSTGYAEVRAAILQSCSELLEAREREIPNAARD